MGKKKVPALSMFMRSYTFLTFKSEQMGEMGTEGTQEESALIYPFMTHWKCHKSIQGHRIWLEDVSPESISLWQSGSNLGVQ